MAEPTAELIDGRVVLRHMCLGEVVEATLNNAEWTVLDDDDPLTVKPSVACDRCGLHGWITGGSFWGTFGQQAAPAAPGVSE